VVRGLRVRVTSNGIKSFALKTYVDGKEVRVTLGQYPNLKLSDARKQAQEMLVESRKGVDPRKDAKAKEEQQNTFNIALALYSSNLSRRVEAAQISARYAKEAEQILGKEFGVKFGSRAIESITKAEVMQVVYDQILDRPQIARDGSFKRETSPSAANHALGHIKSMWSWAEGRGLLEHDAIARLRSPAPKNKRTRVLTDDELSSVGQSAESIGWPYGDMIRLLILTAQRRGEVAGLRVEYVDLEKQLWRVPVIENKSKRDYIVPLAPQALEIVKRAIGDRKKGLLFPSPTEIDRPFSNWTKSKLELDEKSGIQGWVVHDLRRTGYTTMGKLKVPVDIKELVVNHARPTLRDTYDQWGYLDEKRNALVMLDEHVARLTR
jgi:integrase